MSFFNCAQLDYGFIGKKNAFGISVHQGSNLFFHFHRYFGYNTEKYEFRRERVRFQYKLDYYRLLGPNITLGLEVGYKKVRYDLVTHDFFATSYGNDYIIVEPTYDALSLIPHLSIHPFKMMPFRGLSIQMGIGPVINRLNKNSLILSANGLSLDDVFVSTENTFIAMNLFFQLNQRFALAKGFYLEVGGRVNSDFVFGHASADDLNPFNNYGLQQGVLNITSADERKFLKDKGRYNIFTLKVGIIFQF